MGVRETESLNLLVVDLELNLRYCCVEVEVVLRILARMKILHSKTKRCVYVSVGGILSKSS